jgi:hypothetical protein
MDGVDDPRQASLRSSGALLLLIDAAIGRSDPIPVVVSVLTLSISKAPSASFRVASPIEAKTLIAPTILEFLYRDRIPSTPSGPGVDSLMFSLPVRDAISWADRAIAREKM